MIDYIWRINGLDVYYTNETNGGGDHFALEYIDVIRDWYECVDNALEWCSGPGFIGYGLLASGLCKNISFNDMYDPAIQMLEQTKSNSKYMKNISIHRGNNLDSMERNNQFNLVVGNPPHWKDNELASRSLGFDITEHKHIQEILVDQNWEAHKSFYKNMKTLLHPNGTIVLQENAQGSSPDDFNEIVKEAGLKIKSYANSVKYDDIYYLVVEHE